MDLYTVYKPSRLEDPMLSDRRDCSSLEAAMRAVVALHNAGNRGISAELVSDDGKVVAYYDGRNWTIAEAA